MRGRPRLYAAADAEWEHLGRTPIKDLRLARGAFRFRVEKEGFEPLLLASTNPGILFQNLARRGAPLQISLLKTGAAPDMVPVPGGPFPVGLSGFNSDVAVSLDPFTIDRTEVSEQSPSGSSRRRLHNTRHWTGMPLVKAGRELTTQELPRSSRFDRPTWPAT